MDDRFLHPIYFISMYLDSVDAFRYTYTLMFSRRGWLLIAREAARRVCGIPCVDCLHIVVLSLLFVTPTSIVSASFGVAARRYSEARPTPAHIILYYATSVTLQPVQKLGPSQHPSQLCAGSNALYILALHTSYTKLMSNDGRRTVAPPLSQLNPWLIARSIKTL